MDNSDEDTMKNRANSSSSSEEDIKQPKETNTNTNTSIRKTNPQPNNNNVNDNNQANVNCSIRLDQLGEELLGNKKEGQSDNHFNQNNMFRKKNDSNFNENKGNPNNNEFGGRGGTNFNNNNNNDSNNNFRGREGFNNNNNNDNNNNFRGREGFNNSNGFRRREGFNNNNDYGGKRYYNYNQGGRPNNRFNRPGGPRQDNFNNYDNNNRQRYGGYNNNNYRNQNYNQYNYTRGPPVHNINNDPFYITNKNLILDISQVFPEMKEKDILIFLKTRSMGCKLTIFEIMNSLTRESRIISHLNKVKTSNRKICDRLEITEAPYSNDIIDEQVQVLKHFKVYSLLEGTTHNFPSNFYYNDESERRRKLEKDHDGLYTYIPRLYVSYPGQNLNTFGNVELYAKNINEVDYHSLQYKTVLCRKDKCDLPYCPNAHNMEQDFRLIYEYRKEDICKLMLSLLNYTELLRIENYLEHFDIPLSFNLSNFKIHRCELHFMGNACHVDPHLCLCYHNQKEEKRRPPGLFRYQNEKCQYAQPEFGGEYKESFCPYGMFCPNLHSNAEMNYHEDNFRQMFQCTRKRKNGKCIFHSTCYGIHDYSDNEEEDDKENDMSNNEILEQLQQEYVKEMEKVSKFACHSCGNIPQDVDGKRTYCVNKICGDFLCMKCFKECIKNKPPKCCCCQGEIVKGEMFKVIFNEGDNEDKE